MSSYSTHRILVVDDEKDILQAYEKVLSSPGEAAGGSRFDELENKLFNSQASSPPLVHFSMHCCQQGREALDAVRQSLADDRPFSTAFIDVRMPPGPDGIWTAERIRDMDPFINIVIVTAYSDISPEDIAQRVQPPERLLYMQKPFHSHEIRQFASALSAKWQAEKSMVNQNEMLEKAVKQRTSELSLAVEALEESNEKYKETAEHLQKAEKDLEVRNEDLAAANLSLKKLARNDEDDRKEVQQKVLFTIHEMVEPYLDKLEKSGLADMQTSFVKIIRTNLQEIVTPFTRELGHRYFRLNPTELNIANLIKQGMTTKAICEHLNMTKRNVDFYRDRIREKIGIKNTKANLKTVLKEMEIDFLQGGN